MEARSIYKRYTPGITPDNMEGGQELWFVFYLNKILVKVNGMSHDIPTKEDLSSVNFENCYKQYLGLFDGIQCYCLEAQSNIVDVEGFYFKELRALLNDFDEDTFLLAGRAFQYINWYSMNKYCGKCGNITEVKETERVKVCPKCKAVFYPRISPAIIVAVTWGEKILLAHNKNFPEKLYSLVAGFMEPGETFEDCVHREVMEEIGIKIKNIKYFGSQPWPFPDSLMIGFTAQYDSGDICVDNIEIGDANWYTRDNLPQIPTKDSIAGRIIRKYLADEVS